MCSLASLPPPHAARPPCSLITTASPSAQWANIGHAAGKQVSGSCMKHVDDGTPCWAACCCPFLDDGSAGGDTRPASEDKTKTKLVTSAATVTATATATTTTTTTTTTTATVDLATTTTTTTAVFSGRPTATTTTAVAAAATPGGAKLKVTTTAPPASPHTEMTFKPSADNKRVIAYSYYGVDNPRYTDGLLENAKNLEQ